FFSFKDAKATATSTKEHTLSEVSESEVDPDQKQEEEDNTADGNWFLREAGEQKIGIKHRIRQCENWLHEADHIPEDAVGKIRAAIGKANLLVDKKFHQFEQLCHDSIVSIPM